MPSSPKRKSEMAPDAENDSTKRAKTTPQDASSDSRAEEISIPPTANGTPDSLISHSAALAYWSSIPASVSGVLGGYPQVSRIDIQGSSNFLAKLRRQSTHFPPSKGKLKRVVDCGAGIGRITTGFLSKVAEVVDVVEPVVGLTEQCERDLEGSGVLGVVYNVGLEEWDPQELGLGPYDLIWNQWCVGQLTDAQLVAYLKRLPPVLSAGGWIVVKENLSNHVAGEDVFDETDSSVTRTDTKFRKLFDQAGLKTVSTEQQRGFPRELYPVRVYALQKR